MKNFSKEQLAVFIVSIVAVLILALQIVSVDPSTSKDDIKTRYISSVDSVSNVNSIVSYIEKGDFAYSKDILNFKIMQLKGKVEEKSIEKTEEQVQTRWINTTDIDLFDRSVISFSMFVSGKARFIISGKTQEINVGDVLKVGKIVQREVIVGSNQRTGRTRTGADYSAKVLSIGERSVFVDTGMKDNVIQFRPGADSRFYARNLMQDSSAEDKESPSDPTDTPGRRPGRGGR